jgi:hypothetical protein
MKATLHKNELVLSADDDNYERLFLQLIGNQEYIYKKDYEGREFKLTTEYCSATKSLRISRELQNWERPFKEKEGAADG